MFARSLDAVALGKRPGNAAVPRELDLESVAGLGIVEPPVDPDIDAPDGAGWGDIDAEVEIALAVAGSVEIRSEGGIVREGVRGIQLKAIVIPTGCGGLGAGVEEARVAGGAAVSDCGNVLIAVAALPVLCPARSRVLKKRK